MVKVTGAKAHSARLKRISGAAMVREVGKAVYAAADEYVVDAALSITAGATSGKGHVASLPGEPPNADTHDLDRSGHVERVGPLKANGVFDSDHAVPMEVGSSHVAARPFAGPAAQRVRPKAQRLVAEAVKRVTKGGTL